MLKRLRLLFACFLFGHDETIVSWTDRGMATSCNRCGETRHLDLPKSEPTEHLDD